MILVQCSPTAQWLYQRIEPMLWDGSPCGYLNEFENQLADRFKVSQATISVGLSNLRQNGLLRKSITGYWYAPQIISELVKRCGL